MIALWWVKLQGYVYAFGAVLAAIAAAIFYGREKGKASEQRNTDAAKSDAATAQATTEQLESRHETDAEVQKLPDAPAQTVGNAAPGTAAGELRDNGWTRD